MKKLLLFILLIGILWFFFVFKDSTTTGVDNNVATNTDNFQPDPSSATFTFDEGPITLSSGKGEEAGNEVELLGEKASGDLNADNKEDSVVLLASSGGGSGVFVYVAAYVSGPVSYKGTNAVFVGDRISPESLSISNGVVTFNYLDRKPDEPFAAEPTVPASLQFVYRNGSLEAR